MHSVLVRVGPHGLVGLSLVLINAQLAAAPGLRTLSAGHEFRWASPNAALGPGEGFTPTSATAGIAAETELSVHRAGVYQFFPLGASLRIDGQHVGGEPIHLQAGTHRFELTARRRAGSTRVSVSWQGPGFDREPIPLRLLRHHREEPHLPQGRRIFEDLGCANCHASGSPSLNARVGPVLTGIASRVNPAWILRWLEAPSEFRSWATMPQLLSASERGDVATYLSGLRSGIEEEPSVRKSHEERGRTMFQSIGCGACHSAELPLANLGSKLTAGSLQRYLLDPIRFSPAGLMPSFHLNEAEALDLAAYLVASRNQAFEMPTATGDGNRGRGIVQSRGCLNCHTLAGLDSTSQAPRLEALDEYRGCLADSRTEGVPRYRLTDGERRALRRFVASYRLSPDIVPAPTFDLARRLEQLRCRACHEVDGEGPTGPLAEYAPSLTGVGEKLRAAWIEHVLTSETQTLDWQELRMPSYGRSHAAWLGPALAKASGVFPASADSLGSGGHSEEGRNRLGVDGTKGGLGCIGCHGWGEFPPLGENGPNLQDAGQRLRPSWFRRWMRDPARIVAGTSMPNYFGGKETPEFTEAIADFWAAFRAGPKLPTPFGFRTADALVTGEATPIPIDRAVVVRWDMPEATPAAIAVGLPGGTSYCFDAGESRLRYAWRGGFVDMSGTLLTKKNRQTNLTETAAIVGEVFFREGRYPIRSSDRDRIPQRRFRGYSLIGSVPEFRYEVDGVTVRERIVAIEGGILRQFRLEGVEEPMWFVPAKTGGVEIRSTLTDFAIPAGELVSFEVTVIAQE